jgi:hypothetical protein
LERHSSNGLVTEKNPMTKSFGISVAACLLLAACHPLPDFTVAAYDGKLQQLNGHPIDEVKLKWGAPIRENRLDSGMRLVVFSRMMTNYLAPAGCETTFQVDSQGIIAGHTFVGNGCNSRPTDDLGLGLK